MRSAYTVILVAALGCSKSGPNTVERPPLEQKPQVAEVKPQVAAPITVQMTAATLADDCGGGPMTPPRPAMKQEKAAKADEGGAMKAKRRCEQSSIQLSIVSPVGGKPAQLAVKSVVLLDESGTTVGTLQTRAPSVWSSGAYQPWDEQIAPGVELAVSYALNQPDWSKVTDRWNKTFTVKAVVAIDGADRTVQQTVEIGAQTSLPPNVKT